MSTTTVPPPVPLEPAIVSGADPREYAAVLHAVYDAAMSGTRLPARPRSVISDSWRRVVDAGVDPDHGRAGDPLASADLEHRRTRSGLADVLESVTGRLDVLISAGDNVLVVADASGHVLWRAGAPRTLRQADRLGFTEGASWAESTVGTNAIGTALASRQPVQVFSAEHFVRTHHAWTCTGAPIRDPRTGDVLGVVDVSGPAASIHPTTLALVDSVARLTESELREAHRDDLDRLRTVSASILPRLDGPAVIVDGDGWVAAVDRLPPTRRIPLPGGFGPGRHLVHPLGVCDAEPLPGGWLLRRVPGTDAPGRTDLTLTDDGGVTALHIGTGDAAWVLHPSPRHLQILDLLVAHRDGLSAAALARLLFGSADSTVTVRAEMSRLRRRLGAVLAAGPYRFAETVRIVDRRAAGRTI
ncbi:GAF domain-containing protein [Gordonia shandongensis]|uniref:GAF domain-containing protein n=1 Tax=Gordonia shandongensis TaxID=376351 RepID=UPI0004794FFE